MTTKLLPILAVATALAATSAPAASISWSVINMTGKSNDVSTAGTLVSALSGATNGTDFLVNGVNFLGSKVLTNQSNYDNISTRVPATDDSNYTLMLRRVARTGSNVDAPIVFTGLTLGNTYQIQIWASDNTIGTELTVALGLGATTLGDAVTTNSTALLYETSATAGTWGQYALGTFVADSTNMTLNVHRINTLTTTPALGGNTEVNGIQLRDLGVIPEPRTLSLVALSLGLVAMHIHRRRKR